MEVRAIFSSCFANGSFFLLFFFCEPFGLGDALLDPAGFFELVGAGLAWFAGNHPALPAISPFHHPPSGFSVTAMMSPLVHYVMNRARQHE